MSRPPLVVPRDYSTGFIPELLDLESLFGGSEFRGEFGRRLSSLPSFPSHRGDMIVIDDIDPFVADQFFKDLLKPTFVADGGPIWDPRLFDIIPALFPIGNIADLAIISGIATILLTQKKAQAAMQSAESVGGAGGVESVGGAGGVESAEGAESGVAAPSAVSGPVAPAGSVQPDGA